MAITCPRCDGQGEVLPVRINATGHTIYLCNECDAVWLSPGEIGQSASVDFSEYVAQFGLTGLWSEVTVVGTAPGNT